MNKLFYKKNIPVDTIRTILLARTREIINLRIIEKKERRILENKMSDMNV